MSARPRGVPRTATIDGRAVAVAEGETILAAAARAGVDVPALCLVPGLEPERIGGLAREEGDQAVGSRLDLDLGGHLVLDHACHDPREPVSHGLP